MEKQKEKINSLNILELKITIIVIFNFSYILEQLIIFNKLICINIKIQYYITNVNIVIAIYKFAGTLPKTNQGAVMRDLLRI